MTQEILAETMTDGNMVARRYRSVQEARWAGVKSLPGGKNRANDLDGALTCLFVQNKINR